MAGMTARAGIVVTGTEVLTGRVADRNSPWLAEQLRLHGVDIAQVIVVGDRATDLAWSLRVLAEHDLDLVITTGGLGPTADDLTTAVVADVQGRPLSLDPELERGIAEIVARLSAGRGWVLDPAATAAGVRKQALVPVGATVLPPVGTAPGLVVPAAPGRTGPPVLVLPGPPAELQAMWPAALAAEGVQRALAGRQEVRQETLRLWGTPESELAATLRGLEDRLGDLEITTCLRDGELEIVTRFPPSAEADYRYLSRAVADRYGAALFSADGRTVDELVTDSLLERGLTIATAESCTAGLLAARLAERPGASAYLLGGLVVYGNQAKHDLTGVGTDVLARAGAVSADVAAALARGARQQLRADLGVGITGIAGPGGARPGKPVGLVHLSVTDGRRVQDLRVELAGSRNAVRTRATTVALHLVRRFVAERAHPDHA